MTDEVRIVLLRRKGVIQEVGQTYSARRYPIKACSAGKGSGQEGESSGGVFHVFFLFLFSSFCLALRVSGKLFWLEYSKRCSPVK